MATSTVDVHQLEKLRPLACILPIISYAQIDKTIDLNLDFRILVLAIPTSTPRRLAANVKSGAIEQFSSARHHLGFYHNVGISASYTHPSHDFLGLEAVIFSAVAEVVNRHPILSAIPIEEDSAHPHFARLPSINLEEAVTLLIRQTPLRGNEADVELDALLQDQHNLSFKARYGELPFWRLLILVNPQPMAGKEVEFVASFIFHHALGDGGSGVTFQKDFLAALLSSPRSLTTTTILSPNSPLLPNLELIHPGSIPTSTPASPLPGLWSGSKISTPSTSQFLSLTIPAQITKAFLAACRANGTTLTATIPVLIASALSSLLPSKYTDFEACIPVNLRRYLPSTLTNTEPMGVFIDAFSQYYTRSNLTKGKGFSWSEAIRSKGVTDSYLRTADSHINIAKLGKVPDMREFFLKKIGTDRGSSFDVSNLGGLGLGGTEMDRENENGWKMGRMVFSRSAFVAGSAFSTGLVTGPDGCLVFGFVWQEEVVERGLIEGVVGYVKGEIERIAHEG